MNRGQIQRVDPIIKSHGAIIAEGSSLSSKVMYSISCLQNAIEYQNANRHANINYLQSVIENLIVLGEKSKEISEDHMKSLLRLLNNLLTEGNRLSAASQASLIQIILKVSIVNEGTMGEDLCQEIVSLCSKLKNQGEISKLLLELMAQKMSPEQALKLIDSFRKNELNNTEVLQLIKLGTHYNKDGQLLSRIFQALHWQICNILARKHDSSMEGKAIIDFIKFTIGNNINNVKLISLCSLIYRQIVDALKIIDKGCVSKAFDAFLRQNGLKGVKRPYLFTTDRLISNFSQLLTVLELEVDVEQNNHLHYLLIFYSVHEFQWREDLLTSVTNGKGSIAKELMLRATEDFTGSGRVVKNVNEKDQVVYSNFLPIECLRSQASIFSKLQKDPTPHNALRTIGFYHHLEKNHPVFNDILLLLLEIYLKNRQFASLKQIQKIIKDEIKGDFVLKKIKEKGSIKNKDSNKQSKRYFICIPLLCSRSETQSVSVELCQIFIHETIHIAFKLYVAEYTISKMILEPSKAFFVFLNRYIEGNFSAELGALILHYLEPYSVSINSVVSQWYLRNFGETTQKLKEFLFMKLTIPQISETTKICFLLEKFNVYGQNFFLYYWWIIRALENMNEAYSDHILDGLEIMQMVLQKVTAGNIPDAYVKEFERIVMKNWSKYSPQHLFAIDRIVSLLNEHTYIGFKEIALPSLQSINEQMDRFTTYLKKNPRPQFREIALVPSQSDTMWLDDYKEEDMSDLASKYINNVTFNLFFNHIDSHTAFQTLLKFIDQFKGEKQIFLTQNCVTAALNLLLYLFQGSEQSVDSKADELVMNFFAKQWRNSFKIKGKCIQYLSRIPHNINILKIPLANLTTQGFYNTIWLGDLTELLNIVSQTKPKAIGNFKLQQIIKTMIIYLITSERNSLIDPLMDYLEATCFIEGDYQVVLDDSLSALQNALIAERCGVGYRRALIQFSLGTLLDSEYELNQELLWFLMSKYASENNVVSIILQYFQKFPITNSTIHQKLLMRVVLIHNQDQKIQQKCKALFKLYAPKTSSQQQLLQCFANSNYDKCEELIGEVSNPYSLNFSLPDIRSLLQWNNTSTNCKKLLSFLHNHPQHQNKIYQCESFILNSSYISYLAEILEKIDTEPILQKFQNIKKPCLLLKKNQSLEILEKTLINILKNKQLILKLKNLFVDTFKNSEDDFSILLKLVILVFSRQRKQNRTSDQLRIYAKFWNELSGQLQLKNNQKALRFTTKNLIYIFPFFLSNAQIMSSYTHINSLLRHYRSVLSAFSSIQKQIGSNRYFLLLVNSILQNSKNTENKWAYVEQYLKTYLCLEGNEELSLKSDDKAKYAQILLELSTFVNRYAQTKTRQNSNKLEVSFINGYIAHSLFLINQGINLDISTFEIVKNISSNMESLTCIEPQKEIIKQALLYLTKAIEKSLPLKAAQQKPYSKQEKYEQPPERQYMSKKLYQSKKIESAPQKSENQSSSSVKQQKGEKIEQKENQSKGYFSKTYKQQQGQEVKEQPYIRYKQTQQNIIIKQTITTSKTTIVFLNPPSSTATTSEQIFNEQVQKPKEQTFNQDKFYKAQTAPEEQQGISDQQRRANLQKVQKIASGQASIQSLKDHCKYISSLALLTKINAQQFTQLRASITSLDQTVSSHSFYVRKVCQFEISIKLVRIFKTMWRAGEKKNCESLVLDILQFYLSMSKMKERKLVLLSEQQIVQFFKMVVKRTLNSQGQQKEVQFLLQTIYNCRNNTEIYFTLGLVSMLIEVINRDKDPSIIFILEYLIKIELTPQIINQIYQRGLFNKLVQSFNAPLSTQLSKKILCLWIRLAGKVCINQSIQEKFRSKQLHTLVWNKMPELTKPSERKDITHFLAYLCLKNESVTQWMIQAKVPEEILASLGQLTDNQQLYLLFYHFCFGSVINRDYCLRIKYHLHLLGRLNQRWLQTQQNTENLQLSKYFYKSLGQMMTSRQHSAVFFKDQCVKKLIQIFDIKCQPSIFECLLDFISVIETEAEFEELKKQKFWQSLKIFQYKISSEATYSYLLQIFLIMIKKGRVKQFSQAELRNKVCLKAEFSINMQGKQLALRFILALSIRDKQNYFNQRGVNLLASILGFKVSKNQLQLANDILKVEGASKNGEFLKYFSNSNIHGLISESLEKLIPEELKIAYNILLNLSLHSQSLRPIAQAFLPFAKNQLEKQKGQNLSVLLQLLVSFSQSQSNKDLFSFLQIEKSIDNEAITSKAKEKNCEKDVQTLLKNVQKLKGIAVVQTNNQQKLKKAVKTLRQGKKVKMYKVDGSISELLIFISSDCLELNCGLTLSEVVKQKWRLPLNEITKMLEYDSQISNEFKNSYFEKNSGFFSKAPPIETCLSLIGKNNEFHICFPPGEKQYWKANLQMAREYARNLLSNLGKK